MDRLRRKIENLFGKGHSAVNESNQTGEELHTKDVVDLVQKRIIPQQIPSEREPRYEVPTPPRNAFNLTTADQPIGYVTEMSQNVSNEIRTISYEMEFVDFINRNAPQGFAQKLHQMMPYLSVGFFSWPTYWIWRGYTWQSRRQTDRLGTYIQRTFQNAKLMQVAILGFGLLMASSAGVSSEPFAVHEVSFKSNQKISDE